MKKSLLISFVILAFAGFVMAQNATSPVDVLGAHNNNGRGCAGCHQPHSGAYGSGHTVKTGTDTGNYALWGQDASPLYGQTLAFGDGGNYAEVLPATLTAGTADVGGIMLCLSCHDGTVTNTNMMAGSLYEQTIGLLKNPAYGANPIPTLLGNDKTTGLGSSINSNYNNDHPVGTKATLVSFGSPIMGATSGVTFDGTYFQVAAGSQYDTFLANYGAPAIQPGKWGPQYGILAGVPYVTCTTCHDQHVMTVYASYIGNKMWGGIQKDGGGKFYTKLFFINGPYNPNVTNASLANGTKAASTTQFCRQCHFGESNEANNTTGITTVFQ
ncbi:MAG TPA: hypothetical protein VEI01_14260 [Terriglobales bacterium]|nr:hypothetical protein [Terriglobales bacterium]